MISKISCPFYFPDNSFCSTPDTAKITMAWRKESTQEIGHPVNFSHHGESFWTEEIDYQHMRAFSHVGDVLRAIRMKIRTGAGRKTPVPLNSG